MYVSHHLSPQAHPKNTEEILVVFGLKSPLTIGYYMGLSFERVSVFTFST